MAFAEESNAPSSSDSTPACESSQCDSGQCNYCRMEQCQCVGDWYDNTVVFGGGDVYKSIGDRITNINGGTGALTSSPGVVTGFNTGFGLGDSGIRGQFGASYGMYDPEGRIRLVPETNDTEDQEFVTAGVYKRGDCCDPLSYGVVCDAFFADNWGVNANSVELGQLRGIVGYALNPCTEIGAFGTADLWHDHAAVTVAGAPACKPRFAPRTNSTDTSVAMPPSAVR